MRRHPLGFFLSLGVCCIAIQAVAGPLDKYHEPLIRVAKTLVHAEPGFNGNRQYVRTSVDYGRLKKYKPWPDYIAGLAKVDPSKVKTAPLADRKAFWINTFNALVLDSVINHYPIRGAAPPDYPPNSIQAIAKVWDEPHAVAGALLSLRQIVEKLRQLKDPRVFFAISEAAISSPYLVLHAYGSATVENELDSVMNNFCSDPANYRLDRDLNIVWLSQLFDRYGPDIADAQLERNPSLAGYTDTEAAILDFVFARIDPPDRRTIVEKHPAVKYGEFDWTLNDTH